VETQPAESRPPLPESFEEFQNIPLNQIQAGEEHRVTPLTWKSWKSFAFHQSNGLLQPIIVYRDPKAKNQYRIIAGERRWRAASIAG